MIRIKFIYTCAQLSRSLFSSAPCRGFPLNQLGSFGVAWV